MVEILDPVNRSAAAQEVRVRLLQTYGEKHNDRYVACAYRTFEGDHEVKMACVYDRCDVDTVIQVRDDTNLTPSYEMAPFYSLVLDSDVDNVVEVRRAIFRALDKERPGWDKQQWRPSSAAKNGYVTTRNIKIADYLNNNNCHSVFGSAPMLQVLRGYGDWHSMFNMVDEPSFVPAADVQSMAEYLNGRYNDASEGHYRIAAFYGHAKLNEVDHILLMLFDRRNTDLMSRVVSDERVRYYIGSAWRTWLPVDASALAIHKAMLKGAAKLTDGKAKGVDILPNSDSQELYSFSHCRLLVS